VVQISEESKRALPVWHSATEETTQINIMITRHCSYLFNPRRDAVICHSATHRSTFRLSSTATTTVFRKDGKLYQRAFTNCRKAFSAFQYWSGQGHDAVDSFIEAIEIDSSLHTAERLAISAINTNWKFSSVKGAGKLKGRVCTAVRHEGGFQTILSAGSWQDLNERINES
jgi:hypothetical protein